MESSIRNNVAVTLSFAVLSSVKVIVVYILLSKWLCCPSEAKSLADLVLKYCRKTEVKYETAPGDENRDEHNVEEGNKKPLCTSSTFVGLVEGMHLFSKFVIIVSNIIYLVVVPNPEEEKLPDSKQHEAKVLSYYLTYAGSIYEIGIIIFFPVYIGVCAALCQKNWNVERKNYCAYVKYIDLQFAITFAPFASVHQHYLGGFYWAFILMRLFFYCTTFVAVVIVGVRFFIACLCVKCVDKPCCSDGEAVEIKDCKHLVKDVGFQLFSITINLFTGASALSTYFKIAVIQSDPVRYAYLAITLLSCINAIASTFYNALLLRWIVLKEDDKIDDSAGSKILRFLKLKAPSSHITFAIGLVIYFGQVSLNSYILHSGDLGA